MNNLAEKLAELCTIEYRASNGMYVEQVDTDKFAELIVQECINLRTKIELVGLYSEDYEQGVWEGLQMYENQIKRHFGVE